MEVFALETVGKINLVTVKDQEMELVRPIGKLLHGWVPRIYMGQPGPEHGGSQWKWRERDNLRDTEREEVTGLHDWQSEVAEKSMREVRQVPGD